MFTANLTEWPTNDQTESVTCLNLDQLCNGGGDGGGGAWESAAEDSDGPSTIDYLLSLDVDDLLDYHDIQFDDQQSCVGTELAFDSIITESKTKKTANKAGDPSSRVWYKCAWEGCSFGSFYNGVVRRHCHKRHSGGLRIDKASNVDTSHRFRCDWPGCQVSLVAYHKLVEHKRKHTGEKPFRCKWNTCSYATARLYSMIIHERTHKLDLQ